MDKQKKRKRKTDRKEKHMDRQGKTKKIQIEDRRYIH